MRPKLAFHFALAMLLFFSCIKEKEPACKVQSGNIGIIVKSYSNGSSPCWEFNTDRFIVRNESDFKHVASYDTSGYTWCDGKKPESIDFSQYTLLGLRASTNGGGDFLRTAIRNDAEKKIYYEVFSNTCIGDLAGHTGYNMVLIPKVPDDYTVEFSVRED